MSWNLAIHPAILIIDVIACWFLYKGMDRWFPPTWDRIKTVIVPWLWKETKKTCSLFLNITMGKFLRRFLHVALFFLVTPLALIPIILSFLTASVFYYITGESIFRGNLQWLLIVQWLIIVFIMTIRWESIDDIV